MATCVVCGGELAPAATGRPRSTCSDACRMRKSRRARRPAQAPRDAFRNIERPHEPAPSEEMQGTTTALARHYGGHRIGLQQPTEEQLAHAAYVDALLARLFAPEGLAGLRRPSRPVAPGTARTRGPASQLEEVAA